MSKEIKDSVSPFTMVGEKRLDNAIWAVKTVNREGVEGCLVECGTWKCGVLGLMSLVDAECSGGRRVHGFDSFAGLPPPSDVDGHAALTWTSKLSVDIDQAYDNLRTMGAHAILHKGLFQDTLRASRDELGKIAVLRLDGDWYESTMTSLNDLYDLVSPGGFIIIDDYGHWKGCKKATDDFRLFHNIKDQIAWTDYTEVWWRKSE